MIQHKFTIMKQQYEEQFLESRDTTGADRKFWNVFFTALAIAFAIVGTTAAFSSCHTVKRACKTLDAHPKERAEFCADRYKPVEKTVTKTKYLPGKKILTHDTSFVTVDCDSVVKATVLKSEGSKKGTVNHRTPATVRVPVPTYLQVDTAAIESVIERESSAMQDVLNRRIDSLKSLLIKKDEILKAKDAKIDRVTTQRNWGCGLFALLFSIVIVILWMMKKGVIR